MTIEKQEKPAFSPEFQLRKANAEVLMNIIPKINDYLKFIENSRYIRETRKSELGYAKKDWPQIESLFNNSIEILNKLEDEKKVAFHHENSLGHVVGNYALMAQGNIEGKMKKNISVGISLTPEDREKMRDLNEEDIQIFAGFKKEWDLILYYLELVKNHPDILEAEMTSEDGWLGEYRDFFREQKIPTMGVKHQLKIINFFARLENYHSELGDVRGLKNLVDPINEGNFEAEFSRLPKNEFLDKEGLRKYFLEEPEHRQAA